MNSFQQVLLGLACVGGAFGLGHYLNNSQPLENEIVSSPGDDFFRAPLGASLLEPAEAGGVASLPNYRAPSKLNRAFEPIELLPPPGQLADLELPATSPATLENQVTGLRQSPLSSAKEEWNVEVPDFSELVDRFNQVAMVEGAPESSLAASQKLHSARKIQLPQLAEPEPHRDRSMNQQATRELGLNGDRSDSFIGSADNAVPSPHEGPSEIERRKMQVLDPTIDRYRLQLSQLSQAEDRTRSIQRGQGNDVAIGQATNLESDTAVNVGSHANFNPDHFTPNLRSQPQSVTGEREDWAERTFSILEPPAGDAMNQQQPSESTSTLRSNRVRSYSDPFPPLPNEIGNAAASRSRTEFAGSGQSPSVELPLKLNVPVDSFGIDSSPSSSGEAFEAPPIPQADPGFASWRQSSARETYPTQRAESGLASLRDEEDWQQRNGGVQGTSVTTNDRSAGLTPLRQFTGNNVRPVQANRFENYVTQGGDSLASISKRFYGKPDYYLDIYLVNQTLLRSPAEVPSGVTLRIPVFD